MLRLWILLVLSLSLVADRSPAENGPLPPPPRSVSILDLDKSKNIVVLGVPAVIVEIQVREIPELVEVLGKKVPVTKQIIVNVVTTVIKEVKWDTQKGHAINSAGKKISREELFQKLKAGDTILIYSTKNVDPSYLKTLKDDVILLHASGEMPGLPIVPPEPIPPPKQ